MVYGLGTRSYNRSTEKRQMDKDRHSYTQKFLDGTIKIDCELRPLCTCRPWFYPHPLEAHAQLEREYSWEFS